MWGSGHRAAVGMADVVSDLRTFHDVPPPTEPAEFRTAAYLVKALTYLALAFPIVLPLLVAGAILTGRLAWADVTGNWLLLLAILAAIPTFVLLSRAYPAFVDGEKWSLAAVALVGFGLLALTPARFLTEAASKQGQVAIPPTRVEWIVFLGAAAYLYVVLSPETRAGMRAARARNAVKIPPRETTPASGAAATSVRYRCPNCARVYVLPKAPPPGTMCPRCREAP